MEMFEILYRIGLSNSYISSYCWNLENISREIETKKVGEWRETCLRSLEFICSKLFIVLYDDFCTGAGALLCGRWCSWDTSEQRSLPSQSLHSNQGTQTINKQNKCGVDLPLLKYNWYTTYWFQVYNITLCTFQNSHHSKSSYHPSPTLQLFFLW